MSVWMAQSDRDDRELKENSSISRGTQCLVVKVAEEWQNVLDEEQLQGFSAHI